MPKYQLSLVTLCIFFFSQTFFALFSFEIIVSLTLKFKATTKTTPNFMASTPGKNTREYTPSEESNQLFQGMAEQTTEHVGGDQPHH